MPGPAVLQGVLSEADIDAMSAIVTSFKLSEQKLKRNSQWEDDEEENCMASGRGCRDEL
jgi:hypothetical protein